MGSMIKQGAPTYRFFAGAPAGRTTCKHCGEELRSQLALHLKNKHSIKATRDQLHSHFEGLTLDAPPSQEIS